VENTGFINRLAGAISPGLKKGGLARLRGQFGFNHLLRVANDRSSAITVSEENPWYITGASVTGHGHRSKGEPCQDAHLAEVWGNGWGAVAVSDGAGSALKSQLASSFLVKRAVKKARKLVRQQGWEVGDTLPTLAQWTTMAHTLMSETRKSLQSFATSRRILVHELHATLILTIFSPYGLLTAHIGDGRAGCLDLKGNYQALIEPWEGEQAGQTVFVTMGSETIPLITRTSVFREPVRSFFILTDGCERVAWQTLQRNAETGLFMKKNEPFAPFFDQTLLALTHMLKTMNADVIAQNWHQYLDSGHKGFVSETDDKTMVVGVFKPNHTMP